MIEWVDTALLAADAAGGSSGGAIPPLLSWASLFALLTLAALEIVLGIDNIVFIAIITGRLDAKVQVRAQRAGLLGAMFMRIVLLLCISWVMGLTADLFSVLGMGISGKDLILLGGGLFLMGKATYEIHHKLESSPDDVEKKSAASFAAAIVQIMLIDAVFSLDSVITAIGIANHLTIMITAIVLAVVVMMIFAAPVSRFVEKHPTMKMLALAFLILIGVLLVAEGMGHHLDRGYIYFAMGFSLLVELLNMRVRGKRGQRRINQPHMPGGETPPATAG